MKTKDVVQHKQAILNLFQNLQRLPFINGGFTLIEILVAVLIIGILAAIAVPQYQRALLKSRYAALMPIAKSMANSNEAYYLEHGIYADDPQDLLIQGQSRYTDDTELEFGTVSDYAYVLAKNEDKIPNNTFVVYQKHSGEFPGEIHCEALADNDLAESVCKSFGGNESIGKTLTDGYETYVLFGTGNGVAPTGDNGGNDEPEEPACPDNSVCDEDGNVTGCASGYRLRNEVCETIPPCPTGSTCNEEGDVTGCATGYHSEGNACVETPPCPEGALCDVNGRITECPNGTYISDSNSCATISPNLQTLLNSADCSGNYNCHINPNGTVSQCSTGKSTYNSETHRCDFSPSNGAGFIYENIYNSDGHKVAQMYCNTSNTPDNSCSWRAKYTLDPSTGDQIFFMSRRCSLSVTIDDNYQCPDGEYWLADTYDKDLITNIKTPCTTVGPHGECNPS